MYLFFDVETNGLPKNYNAPVRQIDNWPRIIQLAWAKYDDNATLVNQQCQLIEPDNWEIPDKPFWRDNAYSTKRNRAEGVPIQDALSIMTSHIDTAHTLVAHNLKFDHAVVCAEMIRSGIAPTTKPAKRCTMLESVDLCKIPHPKKKGYYKWPKLEELHQFLFGKTFDNAHDALADVKATASCFFEMNKP